MDKKIIEFDNGPKVCLGLAEKYISEDRFEDALRCLFTAYKESVDSRITKLIAETYSFMELYELSNKYWIRYIDETPESDWGKAYEQMALNYFYLDNFFLSSYYFNKKIEKDGVLDRDDLSDEVIDFLSDNIDKKSLYKVAYPFEEADYSDELRAGRVCLSTWNCAKAMECFNKIPKGAKEYYEALEEKAMVQLFSGEEDKAIETTKKVIKENKESVSLYCNLSTMYHVKGDMEKCRYYYDKALSTPVVREEEEYKLATCSMDVDEHQKVVYYLERLTKDKIYDVELNFPLGIGYLNTGNYEGAKRIFYLLSSISVDNPIYKFYLEMSIDLIQKKQGADEFLPLNYDESFPRKINENAKKRIRKYITMEFKSVKKKLSNKQFQFDINWAFKVGDIESAKIMGFILSSMHTEKANNIVRDILTDSLISDSYKGAMLFAWIVSGEKGYIGISCGSFYNRIKLRHLAIEDDDDAQELFYSYALLLTKLAFIEVEDYDKVSIALGKVYKKFKDKSLSTYTREDIGSLILYLCGYERFRNVSEIVKFMGIKKNIFDRLLCLYNGVKK